MTQDLDIPAEVRTAFAAGPGDEPELRLTAEQLVTTGRRQLRRRRIAGTGVAAVAVGAVLATVFAVLPGAPTSAGLPAAGHGIAVTPTRTPPSPMAGPNRQPQTVPATAVPGTATAPTGPPPTASTRPPETEAARLHRLTAALQTAVHPPAGGRLETAESFRAGLGTLEAVASQGGYKAVADERDPLGRGSLFVEVDDGADVTLPDPCADTPACTSRRTGAGDLIAVSTQRQNGEITYAVDVQRVDGTQVFLMASNYAQDSVPQRKDAPPVGAQRPAPPWTADQLIAIALTPDLWVD